MNWIAFEVMIEDMCEEENIKTAKELTKFSQALHESLETAIQDYAYDESLEGYEPNY